MDAFNGRWDSVCTHVTAVAKLAKQARLDQNSDPYILFYCEAFANALPLILKRAHSGNGQRPSEKNSIVRLKEAVQSLELARISLENVMPKVQSREAHECDRITRVLKNAETETIWLLERWHALLRKEAATSPPDEEPEVSLHRVECPFSTIITELNVYLDHGGNFDVAKFEVAMERTMPFWSFAKAGPNLKMREDAAELMYLGSQMRGRNATFPASSPDTQQLAIRSNLDSG